MISNICIAVLLLIAGSCIARSIKDEIKLKSPVNHLVPREQADNVSCSWAISFLQICPTTVMGALVFMAPLANDCEGGVFINMTMNLTNIYDVNYSHHFIGSILLECSAGDVTIGNISGSAYFTDGEYNVTTSICNGQCDNYSISGEYESIHLGECNEVLLDGGVC